MHVKEYIYRNVIRCKKCGDIIESFHQHDFKFCHCGEVAVDGGKSYIRRQGTPDAFEELSVYVNKPSWTSIDKDGKYYTQFIFELSGEHIENIIKDGYNNIHIYAEAYKRGIIDINKYMTEIFDGDLTYMLSLIGFSEMAGMKFIYKENANIYNVTGVSNGFKTAIARFEDGYKVVNCDSKDEQAEGVIYIPFEGDE
ncbi:hypothetical protein [uncultured Arcobacter sp.]|uniref:DUF7695 domain-containing protein n=1 Tax=uncultured Arcobacter sp. TaxID=165434 RepID=UPI002606D939|nr:hypothetical protein [uncultured Arcobacter sp.]